MSVLGSVGGAPFTEEMAQALADEAEAGFSPERLTVAPPPLGVLQDPSTPRQTVVVNLPSPLAEALADRAAATNQTSQDLAIKAIADLLAAGV